MFCTESIVGVEMIPDVGKGPEQNIFSFLFFPCGSKNEHHTIPKNNYHKGISIARNITEPSSFQENRC
jgi:hypothetical protein